MSPRTADRPPEPTRRLTVEIPDSLHHRLRLLALRERTTLRAIIHKMLTKRADLGGTPND